MKIVITIDDKLYERIKYLEPKADTILDRLMKAVQNGTPLPKGRWHATEDEEINIIGYYCSQCDLPMETENRTKYCPYCGCQMEEYDESFD